MNIKERNFFNFPESWFQRLLLVNRVRWLQISYCQQHVEIFVVYMNIKQTNFEIGTESWFQRLLLVNRAGWLQISYCQQHVVNICCIYENIVNKFQNCPTIVVTTIIIGYSVTLITNIILSTTCGDICCLYEHKGKKFF